MPAELGRTEKDKEVMATDTQVFSNVDEIVKSKERAFDLLGDNEPISFLLDRFGENVSVGRTEK